MPLRDQSAIGGSYWVLDRNSGKYILVTSENRQIYHDATRYITIHDMPVPTDTQDVFKILTQQYENGIKAGEFTAEDIESAAEGLTGRRFAHGQQGRSRVVLDEPEVVEASGHPDPLAGINAEGVADFVPEPDASLGGAEVTMAPEFETEPAPVKKTAVKKSPAKKKTARKKA